MNVKKRANYENHNVLWTDAALRKSSAFRSLHGTAILVLMDFHSKKHMRRKKNRGNYELQNNGELVYTYSEAQEMGISNSTFMRALDTLIERGFIDVALTGAGRFRCESRYALSNRWRHWGTDKFKPAKRNPHGRNKEYGFQPGHTHHRTDGRLKNVTKNDNNVGIENSDILIETENSDTGAVVDGDNELLSKPIIGKNEGCTESIEPEDIVG